MALVVKDRVQELTTTSGTGTLTLAGAVPGYQTFSSSIGNGNTTFYTIYDNTAQDWEVGIGTVGAGTLARTTVLSNSLGTTAKISFVGNSSFVFCTYPAEQSINYDANDVATIGQTLGYADTGIVGSFASTVAGYNQVIVQNKSTATNASSNLNVSNDAGTAGSNYAELGINSSTFTGSGSFNIAGASYVASASTDLTLGTYGAYNVHFVTNSNTTDAMTIFNNGGISLGGFANPGIKNIAASKFVPGYTAITSAAGTTVLTADSNYYQNLLGSTTQTFQLPDATTLLVGTTFIFDNDSSGVLTVVDNASGPVETIPSGAAGFVYLAVNSTVAGTWRRHGFIPASYDFNATTANFGTATITNASWNGNTIGTAYGGTGLTTFGSANYALYSTSSSALVAGTLPTAAGGTGLTTYTTGDIIYASATNTLSKLAAGTNGYVLTLASGIPSWAANNAATTRTVNTFTATASQTTFTVSYTVGLIDVYRNGVKLAETDYTANNGTTVVLNTGANSGDTVETVAYSALSIGTGVTSFSTGTTGLTPTSGSGNITLAGTLNVANGGTGLSTLTAGYIPFGADTSAFGSSANLFWNNTNNRLGIGTTSPSNTLDVQSTNASGQLKITKLSGGADNFCRLNLHNSTAAYFQLAANPSVTDASSTLNIFTSGAGSNIMTLLGNGNVGIGASPTEKLTVIGNVRGEIVYGNRANAAAVTAGGLGVGIDGTVQAQIVSPSSSAMAIYTGGTERMRIDSSGKVLVNTTTARANFFNSTFSPIVQVEGTSFDTSSLSAIRNTDTTAAPNIVLAKSRGTTVGSNTIVQSGDGVGVLSFQGNDGTEFVEAARITGLIDGTPGANDMPGALSFSTTADGAASVTERMRIDSSGNVGIGTTSPSGKLDITQATNGNVFVVNAPGGSTPNFTVQGSGEQTFRLYNSASTGSTRTSIKLASRLNTDWEWIVYTDTGVTGTNDLLFSNLAGLALYISSTRIVSDYKGDLRAAPIQSKTAAYVLVATDAGQTISITTGGVTVNASILSAGDMVSIFNNSGSSQTITQGASVTLRLSGTATTGNRTLAQYGVATLLCVIGGATPTFACTGAGLT